ncbi:MAG TPA: BTAD domain-containing putative transcriptional regulator [Pseudonocardiaceae bacterium]|jgi:DNA-binding SARP family transcriptional activator|nr:BTAD domain-containing putative transcriptional regulator [Pseudonocardiaceae bacterium]
MEFRVLGPIEVLTSEKIWDIGRPMQQCVLAVLLTEPNRVVPTSRLIDRTWGEDPPISARNVLYGHIGRLRAVLSEAAGVAPDTVLARRSGGYMLRVNPRNVDVHQFRQLLAAARRTADIDRAAALFEKAQALWRGPAFAGVASPWLANLRATLDNERLSSLLDRNSLFIQQGRGPEILTELRQLSQHHPFDERIAHQLISALCLAGNQADALAAYTATRARLAEELGLDPGPPLRALERQILTGDPALLTPPPPTSSAGPRPPTVLPRQLPADICDFTGREVELTRLDAVAESAPVCMITGPPGIGKTALGVHWAHRVGTRFPDGELYADLHGSRGDPAEVLARFVRALGVEPAGIPPGLDECAEIYRSLVSGRRILVVLDNAGREDQVQPLLPGNSGCQVLVTGHHRLGAIAGARHVELGALTEPEANALLARIVGRARVRAEPQATATLVGLCERWPLALRIVGSKLVAKPHWSIAHLVSRLTDERHRLDELSYGTLDFRTTLATAYETLGSGARQLFQSLGHLDRRQDVPAGRPATEVVSLADAPRDTAEDLFEQLIDARLLEPAGPDHRGGAGYRVHSLVRLFARERASGQLRRHPPYSTDL